MCSFISPELELPSVHTKWPDALNQLIQSETELSRGEDFLLALVIDLDVDSSGVGVSAICLS